MMIVYNEMIVNYHKDWKGFTPQIWRKEFGPIITPTRILPSASAWLVPGTKDDD